jgi:hypothetical protein
MRRAITYTVFPGIFGSALLATWWMITAGMAASMVVFSVSLTGALSITLMERLLPYEKAWATSHGDLPTDLVYAISSLFAAPRLFDTLALATLIPLVAHFTGDGLWWPQQLPWGLQVLLAVVLAQQHPLSSPRQCGHVRLSSHSSYVLRGRRRDSRRGHGVEPDPRILSTRQRGYATWTAQLSLFHGRAASLASQSQH